MSETNLGGKWYFSLNKFKTLIDWPELWTEAENMDYQNKLVLAPMVRVVSQDQTSVLIFSPRSNFSVYLLLYFRYSFSY